MKKYKNSYPFIGTSSLPERKRKAGTKCRCCKGVISVRNTCICKTILD